MAKFSNLVNNAYAAATDAVTALDRGDCGTARTDLNEARGHEIAARDVRRTPVQLKRLHKVQNFIDRVASTYRSSCQKSLCRYGSTRSGTCRKR